MNLPRSKLGSVRDRRIVPVHTLGAIRRCILDRTQLGACQALADVHPTFERAQRPVRINPKEPSFSCKFTLGLTVRSDDLIIKTVDHASVVTNKISTADLTFGVPLLLPIVHNLLLHGHFLLNVLIDHVILTKDIITRSHESAVRVLTHHVVFFGLATLALAFCLNGGDEIHDLSRVHVWIQNRDTIIIQIISILVQIHCLSRVRSLFNTLVQHLDKVRLVQAYIEL